MGVGYRVLDVGCAGGELAAYLDSLGIRCVGLDESAVHIVEAKRAVPACEFHCGSIGQALAALKGGFDLVLVREVSPYQASLSSPAAFAASFQLLARVRPGACLAFLARIDTGSTAAGDIGWPVMRGTSARCRGLMIFMRCPTAGCLRNRSAHGGRDNWVRLRARRLAIAAAAVEPGTMETSCR